MVRLSETCFIIIFVTTHNFDSLYSEKSREAFRNWTNYDDKQDKFCEIDGKRY